MRAVCYCRTSTLDQAREEKVSIPDQIKWAKTFALEKGWEWLGEYIEPGVQGDTEPDQRAALSKLLQDSRNNLFDIVLVYHSSRLAREPDIGMRVCRLLGQLKKQVYFRNAQIEPVQPEKFAWGINVGAQYMTAFSFIGDLQENIARSERVRSGFQGLARRGKLAFAPYGYKKIPKVYLDETGRQRYDWYFELAPSQAKIVLRIFNLYASDGGSLRNIMLLLNKENVPSPSGKIGIEAWSAATTKNILSNPAYIGKVRWGRKLGGKYLQGKTSSGKQKRIYTSPEKWILENSDHPKLIDDKIFNKVQDKLKLRYSLKGRAIASQGLLTGLVICGRCSRKAYFKTIHIKRKNNKIRSDYVCQSYFRHKSCQRHIMTAKKLHDIVLTNIDKITSDLKYRKKLLKKNGNSKNNKLSDQLNILTKYQKEIETKQQRILIAYESGNLSLEEFGNARRRLDDEAVKNIKEIEEIKNTLNDTESAKIAKKKFLEVLKYFKVQFNKVNFSKQKALLQNLVQSVFVKGNRLTINYRV